MGVKMGDSTRGIGVAWGNAAELVVDAARDRLDEATFSMIVMRLRTGKPDPLCKCTPDDLWQIREALQAQLDGDALDVMEQPPERREDQERLLLALAIVEGEIERRDWPTS
jgi:hypothetical protein